MKPQYNLGDVSDVKLINKTTGETVFKGNCTNVVIESLYDDQISKNLLERNMSIETEEDIGELLKGNIQ